MAGTLLVTRARADHIKEIVTTQQSHATGMDVIEPVKASDLAEDALRLQGGSQARHAVKVIREFEAVPALPLDKGRVLQILVNLISTAKTPCRRWPGRIRSRCASNW